MKNSILNLGKALNKVEQSQINGGKVRCDDNRDGICEYSGLKCVEIYCQII